MTKLETKLEVTKSAAQKAYNDTDLAGKILLGILFGKETFSQSNIDRLNTLEDLYSIIVPTKDQRMLLDYNGTDRKVIGAKNFMIAEMIAEAFNDGWVADYTNNEPKWFGVFDGRKGFVFSHSGYDAWITYSNRGSRLCFKEEKHLLRAVELFPEVYKEVMKK